MRGGVPVFRGRDHKDAPAFEVDGKHFRRVAVPIVLNEQGEMLRMWKDGDVWGLPQGGVRRDEDVAKTAARELYEQVGLDDKAGLEFMGVLPEAKSCSYEVSGGSAKEAGYDGEILDFALFRYKGSQPVTDTNVKFTPGSLGIKDSAVPEFMFDQDQRQLEVLRWSSFELEPVEAEKPTTVVLPEAEKPAFAYLFEKARDMMGIRHMELSSSTFLGAKV
jgi:8-oxo-dGTP pyrophosphatase MutT (NUDIX family)